MRNRFKILFLIPVLMFNCTDDGYTPKPKGYFRLSFPEKEYKKLNNECPFDFEIPLYTITKKNKNNPKESCWFDIEFTNFNASIHFSYKAIENNLNKYLEDSRTLAFKHTIKANDIQQEIVSYPERNVYGLIYNIKGNAASSYQFHLTDSNNHFIRGSLYFNNLPNQDSVQPVLDFIRLDAQHLFETLEWK